jgi:hypothetical protein
LQLHLRRCVNPEQAELTPDSECPQSHECQLCGEHSSTADELKSHLDSHVTLIPDTIMCALNRCGRVFSTAEQLKEHRQHFHRQVLQTTPLEIRVPTFKDKKHHLAKHSKRPMRWYACHAPGCNFSASLPQQLELHKIKVHSSATYTCLMCGQNTIGEANYKLHLASHKTGTPGIVQCLRPGCHQLFQDGDHLRKHTDEQHPDVQRDERLLHCGICTFTYKTELNLMKHAKREHEGFRFQCRHCGKKFKKQSNFRRHSQKHKGDPQMLFKCVHVGCDQVFSLSSDLTAHSARHINVRMRVCGVPDCSFKSESMHDVEMHRINAHSIWPFSCKLCGQGVEQAALLRLHMKRHEIGVKSSKDANRTFDVCQLCDMLIEGGLEAHQLKHETDTPGVLKCIHLGCELTFNSALMQSKATRRQALGNALAGATTVRMRHSLL